MENVVAIELDAFAFRHTQQSEHSSLGPISWSIEQGAFALLTGSTGSGKTTLLRSLHPQLAPNGTSWGTIRIFGEDPSSWDIATTVRTVGYVAQDPESQAVCNTVRNELAFGLENLGVAPEVMHRRIAEVANFLGIEAWINRSIESLSGGEKQVVNLASALALQPRILLLDEPTAQLDPISEQRLLNILVRVNHQLGITVVVATHAPEAFSDAVTQSLQLPGGEAERLKLDILNNRVGRSPSNSSEGITLQHVHYAYPNTQTEVLRGCDLTIEAESIHAIIGGNGSGKTTLLSAMAGLFKIRRGSIKNRLRDCQAFLPQSPKALFVRDTVREELEEWADSKAAETWMRLANLESHADLHPYDLSGGQQQMLALTKLLATQPRLLILDEPTKGLDASAKLHMALLLLTARAKGATIVLASHDLTFIKAIADRVSLLFDGTIACTEPTDSFFEESLFYRPADDAFSHLWEQLHAQTNEGWL